MATYITPKRYRTMALGVDLSAKSDAELRALAASASAEVNRYCATPHGHDFRGGTVVREDHEWNTGNQYKAASGRLWPVHCHGVMPIVDCPRIDIYVTKTNFVTFTTSNIFVAGRLGYVEPVAAPITTALFTSVPPWLLSTPHAYIDYTYGRTYVEVNEELVDTGDLKTYYAQDQWWTDDDVSVRVNGLDVTPESIDRDEGTVTFAVPLTANDVVTADYMHKLDPAIRIATAIVMTDMLGYGNINASGLTGLSAIKVEEIELRQANRTGFNIYDLHPAAKQYLGSFVYTSLA